jgi:hypothetical protein
MSTSELKKLMLRGWTTVLPGEVSDQFVAEHKLLIVKGECAHYIFSNTFENRKIVARWSKEHAD